MEVPPPQGPVTWWWHQWLHHIMSSVNFMMCHSSKSVSMWEAAQHTVQKVLGHHRSHDQSHDQSHDDVIIISYDVISDDITSYDVISKHYDVPLIQICFQVRGSTVYSTGSAGKSQITWSVTWPVTWWCHQMWHNVIHDILQYHQWHHIVICDMSEVIIASCDI